MTKKKKATRKPAKHRMGKIHTVLSSPENKPKVVKAKRGKGSYRRKAKHEGD